MNLRKDISNFFDSVGVPIPRTKCWNCDRYIFNMDTEFGKMGLCVYCYTAYKEGIDSVKNKYPEQISVTCLNCGSTMTIRDRTENVYKSNKIALCCNKPDYTWSIILKE